MPNNNGHFPDYWKVKAAFLEARLSVAAAEAKLAATLREAGLEPGQPYNLVDEDESIRPVTAPKPPEG